MRVAYVCADPGVPVFGCKGASVHVQAVVRVLAARGAEVHLLAGRVGGDPPPGLEDVRVHALPDLAKGTAAQREPAARRSDAAVAAILDGLTAAGPIDLVYERYSLWGRTATAWAQATGTQSVLEVNAPLVEEQATHRELVDRNAAEDVAVAALSAATAVVCVSEGVASWARGRSRRPERVYVVPNGVDTDRIRPAERPPVSAAQVPCTIGFVGTLKPWHGVDLLVDALERLERLEPGGYRLLVVGDGPEAPTLHRRAAELGVAHLMEHVGTVPPADVPRHLHRMDIAAVPAPRRGEAYFSPLKLFEYLAAGLPVVACRGGQVAEVLDGGALGALVEPGDVPALAAAISALRHDAGRRAELRVAGRAAAVRRHRWEAVVDRVLALSTPGTVARAVSA